MHVCYYNSKGILVTHPRYTTKNYLTRGFVGDMLGLIPTGSLLHLFLIWDYKDAGSVAKFYRSKSFSNFNRLLQMYRLPDAFMYFQRDILKNRSVLL